MDPAAADVIIPVNLGELEKKHKSVLEMFADLDLTQMLRQYGEAMTPDALAAVILERMAHIPKKKHGTKRKADDSPPGQSAEAESNSDDDADEDIGDKLIDKMLAELLHSLKAEWRSGQSGANKPALPIRNFLREYFPSVRVDFIDKMLPTFENNIAATAIACFFAENGFGSRLQKLLPKLTQRFWISTAIPKQNVSKSAIHKQPYVPDEIRTQMNRYTELMNGYQKNYPSLLSGLKLTKQARLIPWERTEQEQPLECLVCFDKYPMNKMVTCSAPTVPQDGFFADETLLSISTTDRDPTNANSSAEVITIKDEAEVLTHAFCRGCIRGQAQAATDDVPLVEGGVGLRCMVPECANPILYSEIRTMLSREVRRKLDDRIIEENLGLASIDNLERCKRCNFAMQMDVDKKVNKVFDCLRCGAKFCRLCERPWDDDHIGISCEELDVKTNKDRKERELEKKLNEAVIRKCPRCGLGFMKSDGCNKMTCRCGMKQCYICRESDIDYSHFCQHFRDPKVKEWKCTQCAKTCLLYEDANRRDNQLIEEIRRQEVQANTDTSSGANATQPDPRPTTSNAGNGGAIAMTQALGVYVVQPPELRQFVDQAPMNGAVVPPEQVPPLPAGPAPPAAAFFTPMRPPPFQPNLLDAPRPAQPVHVNRAFGQFMQFPPFRPQHHHQNANIQNQTVANALDLAMANPPGVMNDNGGHQPLQPPYPFFAFPPGQQQQPPNFARNMVPPPPVQHQVPVPQQHQPHQMIHFHPFILPPQQPVGMPPQQPQPIVNAPHQADGVEDADRHIQRALEMIQQQQERQPAAGQQ